LLTLEHLISISQFYEITGAINVGSWQISVAKRVFQTIENSGNAGSHHRSILLLPSAKIRELEIRPCRHGQPMGLKQFPGGKSSSFE
jgi:hypothetical protein